MDKPIEYRLISPSRFLEVVWKNGQGKTLEILKQGLPESEEFSWRLSMATVSVDGYFSDFSGYDRTLVLLNGPGVSLEHSSGRTDRLVNSLDMAHFSGADRTKATLVRGPITDFNIMTCSDSLSAETTKVSGSYSDQKISDSESIFVYAHAHSIVCLGSGDVEKQVEIPEGHLLHLNHPGKSLDAIKIEGLSSLYVKMMSKD